MDDKSVFLNRIFKLDTKIDIVPSSVHKLNPQFSLCDVDIMYTGDNRNMTNLEIDVVKEALYSLYGIPIVGEWLENEKCFGGHGISIEYKDGKIIEKVSTKPIGFVTKEAADNATFIKKKLPNGHEEKTWLHLEKCILWTSRYEEAQYIIDNGETSQSMEVNFEDGYYRDDGVFVATKIIFSALCAIGCEPCFEESKISRHFELDSFKEEFNLMLDEYQKYETDSNNTTVPDNSKIEQKEERTMDFSKITEKLSAYTYENAIGETVSKYSLIDATETSIGVIDREDNKTYSFDCTEVDGEIVIDMDSKSECSMTYKVMSESDVFNYSNEISLATEVAKKTREAELSKSFADEYNAKIDEVTNAYTQLKADYDSMSAEYEKYKAADEARIEKEKHTQIDSIVDKYAKKIGRLPKFLCYRAKIDYTKSAAEIENELILMAGEAMMDTSKQNFSYNPTVAPVQGVKSEKYSHSDRYGSWLDKFMND